MDINTQNSSGMMNNMPPMPQQEKKVGPIVGVLIIVLIIIIAVLYFVGQRLNTQNTEPNTAQETANIDQEQTLNSENSPLTATSIESTDDVQTLQEDLDNELENIDYSF